MNVKVNVTSDLPGKMGEDTRQSLIDAAIVLFGQDGFASTSTRAIANMANSNIGSIAYYFGSKDGLRIACADAVAMRMNSVAGLALRIEEQTDAQQARAFLNGIIDRFVDEIICKHEARAIAGFILREIGEHGPIFNRLSDTVITPIHKALCRLFAIAAGTDPESDDTRLAVFSLAGQLLYFRIGQPLVLSRMGWDHIGEAEARKISNTIKTNISAMITMRQGEDE